MLCSVLVCMVSWPLAAGMAQSWPGAATTAAAEFMASVSAAAPCWEKACIGTATQVLPDAGLPLWLMLCTLGCRTGGRGEGKPALWLALLLWRWLFSPLETCGCGSAG